MIHKSDVAEHEKHCQDIKYHAKHVGDGWKPIVTELHNKLIKLVPEYKILQVKEKFGQLRYYTSGLSDMCDDIVSVAYRMCDLTCEKCGSMTHVKRGTSIIKPRWMKTYCDICHHTDANGIKVSPHDKS
jgi:hypothetical protein